MAKQKKDVDDSLNVPEPMEPVIHTFHIVGISPLLQNNPANFIGKTDDEELGLKKKVYNDEEEAELRVYKDGDLFVHPTEAFIKGMIRAVTGRKFGKNAATSVIKGSVFIAEPWTVILDEKKEPATKYEIDRRPCVVGKARILRCRPCWKDWRMMLSLDIDVAIVAAKHISAALSLTGRTVGIGDYRPEKCGGFGRFKVETK